MTVESVLCLTYVNGQTEEAVFTNPKVAHEWAQYYADGRGNRDITRAVVTSTYTVESE